MSVRGRWEITDVTKILDTPSWITSQGDDGPFFPCLLDARVLGAGRLADWYLYYSTDHSTGAGGIGLAIADDPFGTWTDQGKLFDSTLPGLGGTQAETPDVIPIYDNDNNFVRLSMLGHNFGMPGGIGQQCTWECTSTDGINWTLNTTPPNDIVIDVPYSLEDFRSIGDGHSGYARRIVVSGMELAMHLCGGGIAQYKGSSMRRYRKHGWLLRCDSIALRFPWLSLRFHPHTTISTLSTRIW